MSIRVKSDAFGDMEKIPEKYTCDGEGISPPLGWERVPRAAESLVLFGEDPDAPGGVFVHWVVYDIPASEQGLDENQPLTALLPNRAKQGLNTAGETGYYRPCPPHGTHRYVFKLFALDQKLNLLPGKTKSQVEKAMKGHVIAQGELVGVYSRGK